MSGWPELTSPASLQDGAVHVLRFEQHRIEPEKHLGLFSEPERARAARFHFEIDRRRIQLADTIRALGETDVPVKLHREVTATVKVKVVAQ